MCREGARELTFQYPRVLFSTVPGPQKLAVLSREVALNQAKSITKSGLCVVPFQIELQRASVSGVG